MHVLPALAASVARWRSALVAVLIAATACVGWSPAVQAADDKFPSQPVHLVVGFPPGGSNDMVARIIAPKLAEILGVNVVVENRAGANATIGTDYTARAKPDGYTLTLGSASPLAISPFTYASLPYDPLKDLAGITTVASTPELIAIHPGVPARTLPELVALARTRDVTIASSGNGGLPHLGIEL
ncbi:MAG: tripartite tricarboxylate transporter substrate binding protein, partial [Comamonadaceae bacterium]